MGKRQRKRVQRRHQRSTVPYPLAPTDPRWNTEEKAIGRLRQLVVMRDRVEREIDAEVERLEGWGFSWPTIARALGVSRQAARQRYLRRHTAARY